jgi:hypothetical protein
MLDEDVDEDVSEKERIEDEDGITKLFDEKSGGNEVLLVEGRGLGVEIVSDGGPNTIPGKHVDLNKSIGSEISPKEPTCRRPCAVTSSKNNHDSNIDPISLYVTSKS